MRLAEEFTDLGELPTIEVGPEVAGSGVGTGGGYLGYGSVANTWSGYSSGAAYSYSISAQNSGGSPSSGRSPTSFDPFQFALVDPFGGWFAQWPFGSEFPFPFSDIGGAALGPRSGGFIPWTDVPLDMWYDFGVETLGLPNRGARAFAGVINQESHGEPSAVNPTSHAFGADQWLGPRLNNLADFAADLGLPLESFGVQSLFLLDEFGAMLGNNRELYEMYDPLNTQRRDAEAFVHQFVRPGRGRETRNDINAGANFFPTGYSNPVRSSPLFGLVPLPFEDY